MSFENWKPLHNLMMNPEAWMDASLPKFKASAQEVMIQTPLTKNEFEDMPWSQRHRFLDSFALKIQERRWKDKVGIKPEDSHFTVIVPIHNEEHSLPSFLSTLMLWDIPSLVHMQVIFVTNACNDSSNVIIDAFLSTMGNVDSKVLNGKFKDQYINRCYKVTQQDNITYVHVDTKTPGKANALAIGNSIACECDHIIAMCVDANSFLEPDAMRIMFTHSHKIFHDEPKASDIVLICGMSQTARKVSNFKYLMDKTDTIKQHLIEDSGIVVGCFMAWNTEWMNTIGGPPEVALEDYALGVIARVNNYRLEQVDARVWSYRVNNFKGLLGTRARYVRGMFQILDFVHRDPAVVQIIEKKAYFMKNFPARLRYLFLKSRENPQNFPRYVITFLLWEFALRRGKQDYKKNPTNQSWEKIDATY